MFFILSHSRPKGKGRRASFSLRPKRTYQPLPSRGAAAIPKRSRAFYPAKKLLRSAQDDMFSPPVIRGSTALPHVILRRRSPSPCHPGVAHGRGQNGAGAGAVWRRSEGHPLLQPVLQLIDGHTHLHSQGAAAPWEPWAVSLPPSEVNSAGGKGLLRKPLGRRCAAGMEQAPGRSGGDQKVTRSSSQFFSSEIGTRTCSMVSRSRMVTALSAGVFSSPTVWKSTVMQ